MSAVAEALQVQGDYHVRGSDLRSYFAAFTRRALPDGAIWKLSLASSTLPQGHPGYMVWLTNVSGTERFCPELQQWAIGLGATVARMKPRLRLRARTFVPSYRHDWGRQASLDGLCVALGFEKRLPAVFARAEEFGCDRDAYSRVRDFVAGALSLAEWQFGDALLWATKVDQA